jgi:hypothetical protein
MIAVASAEIGCCFSIGYGRLMEPCCLHTCSGAADTCTSKQELLGGVVGWAKTCPSSARDAARLLKAPDDLVDARIVDLAARVEHLEAAPSLYVALLGVAALQVACFVMLLRVQLGQRSVSAAPLLG